MLPSLSIFRLASGLSSSAALIRRRQMSCIYVGRLEPQKYAAIIHFHPGMTLREIIDRTPFKGTAVLVHVLRAEDPRSMYYFLVGASEQSDYKIKNQDMIWLLEDAPVIQT